MPRQFLPLNALRVLETEACAQSFTAAAMELGVTNGAVSRTLKLLEERLGRQLFMRKRQRSVATDHARAFALEISRDNAVAGYGRRGADLSLNLALRA